MLRSVFMGTPEFALPALEAVQRTTELLLVVTQPDRPAGRGRQLRPPPVKERALELGVEVAQPEASVTRELGERLTGLAPDVVVVAAFGKMLGRKVLGAPRLGCINVHASLLPRHRGASPPVWAILSGDRETGVTIQQMVPGMDAGDILGQKATPIEPDETAGELTQRLSQLGGELLIELLPQLEAGTAVATPQDAALATFAPPLTKQQGAIDWTLPAQRVHDHIRAMNPWPVAFTTCHKGRLRIHRSRVVHLAGEHGRPGEVSVADKQGIHVACGRGAIEIIEAQRDGKAAVRANAMVCGRMVAVCELLGG